jgi:hypothetical protein
MDLREIVREGVDWSHLSQDGPVADCCKDENETSVSMKGEDFFD